MSNFRSSQIADLQSLVRNYLEIKPQQLISAEWGSRHKQPNYNCNWEETHQRFRISHVLITTYLPWHLWTCKMKCFRVSWCFSSDEAVSALRRWGFSGTVKQAGGADLNSQREVSVVVYTCSLENRSAIRSYVSSRSTAAYVKRCKQHQQCAERLSEGRANRLSQGNTRVRLHLHNDQFSSVNQDTSFWGGFNSVFILQGQTAQTCLVSTMAPLWS